MPVFLSHKREDSREAEAIGRYLSSRNIRFYLDLLDPTLQTTDDITRRLMTEIRKCSHIMAIVSSYTNESWWVPFEIGVASELNRRVCTFALARVRLPDYLTKWPILENEHDLDKFANIYELDSAVDFPGGIMSSATPSGAERFHAVLRGELYRLRHGA